MIMQCAYIYNTSTFTTSTTQMVYMEIKKRQEGKESFPAK